MQLDFAGPGQGVVEGFGYFSDIPSGLVSWL